MLAFLKNGESGILKLFFENPEKQYYLREIGKKLGREPGSFAIYLNKLVAEKILDQERRGNLRYFWLNQAHPLFLPLKEIISKTIGVEATLKETLSDLGGLEGAFIFGSWAKNQEVGDSDLDLLLIGEVDQDILLKKINSAEEKIKREIDYHLYSEAEIKEKLRANNDFLTRIFKEPKIILKGDLDNYDFTG